MNDLQVNMLKQELHHASEEMSLQQQGINTLENIDQQMQRNGTWQREENSQFAQQLSDLKRQLEISERERRDLLNNLVLMKDEFNLPDLPGILSISWI